MSRTSSFFLAHHLLGLYALSLLKMTIKPTYNGTNAPCIRCCMGARIPRLSYPPPYLLSPSSTTTMATGTPSTFLPPFCPLCPAYHIRESKSESNPTSACLQSASVLDLSDCGCEGLGGGGEDDSEGGVWKGFER